MTDKQLLKISTGFRKGLLNGQPPAEKCLMVSEALHGYLHFCRVLSNLEESEITFDDGANIYLHWYLRMKDGRILDATASQFNHLSEVKMPEVYLGELPEHYKVIPF